MNHEESQLQQACVCWFRYQYPGIRHLLIAVPNGGARRRVEAAILKAEGVTPGVADLLLLFPSHGYHGLCLELKTATGRQSPQQREWQQHAETAGYKYAICRSLEAFMAEINAYMH